MWSLKSFTSSICVEDPVEIRSDYFQGWMHRSKEVTGITEAIHTQTSVSWNTANQPTMVHNTGEETSWSSPAAAGAASQLLTSFSPSGGAAAAGISTMAPFDANTDPRASPTGSAEDKDKQSVNTQQHQVPVGSPSASVVGDSGAVDEDVEIYEQQAMADQWRFLDIHEEQLRNATLSDSSLHPPLERRQNEELIRAYYSLEYEVVARILTVGRRKDLDEIPEEMDTSLLFCRRQYDNIARVMQSVESESGSMHETLVTMSQSFLSGYADNNGSIQLTTTNRAEFYRNSVADCLQSLFSFNRKLAHEYLAVMFLFKHRIKPLGHDSQAFLESMRCGASMLTHWGSVPLRSERRYVEGSAPNILEFDETLCANLKQISSALPKNKKGKNAWKTKYKSCLYNATGVIPSELVGQLINVVCNSSKELLGLHRQLFESCNLDKEMPETTKIDQAKNHMCALVQTIENCVASKLEMGRSEFRSALDRLVGPVKELLSISVA
eukprot:gb/GECG01004472.1/.p1 GENE.gb/GECG01004472.1/~~gb/GECG01004472.1/.p1  ORF type:complete len:496 (+),score=72.29 gb/GECG01004472.1/:1-1488(+)